MEILMQHEVRYIIRNAQCRTEISKPKARFGIVSNAKLCIDIEVDNVDKERLADFHSAFGGNLQRGNWKYEIVDES